MFYFGSNTKRDLDESAHKDITEAALKIAQVHDDAQLFILPSIPFFLSLKAMSAGTQLWVGNQMISATFGSDVTGEVSAKIVKNLNSDLVMIGHAERRRLFDGDEEIRAQLDLASKEGLTILFCIGESTQADDFNALAEFLKLQIKPLANISTKLVVAYEPVFSIGANGIEADPKYVDQILTIIKKQLMEIRLGDTPILYGGSVNAHNAASYAALDACDGLFVGRSAWTSEGFNEVFLSGYKAYKNKLQAMV